MFFLYENLMSCIRNLITIYKPQGPQQYYTLIHFSSISKPVLITDTYADIGAPVMQ